MLNNKHSLSYWTLDIAEENCKKEILKIVKVKKKHKTLVALHGPANY